MARLFVVIEIILEEVSEPSVMLSNLDQNMIIIYFLKMIF